jgi:UDP-3-O-[3-hydroxymyristoyl] glucosamine N-acyltransferase
MGAMIGDYGEIGCNAVLNPGTIIGRNVTVYPTACVRGVIPANCILKNDGTMVPKWGEGNNPWGSFGHRELKGGKIYG